MRLVPLADHRAIFAAHGIGERNRDWRWCSPWVYRPSVENVPAWERWFERRGQLPALVHIGAR